MLQNIIFGFLSASLRARCLCRREKRAKDPGESLHKYIKKNCIDSKRDYIFNKPDGEKVFPFHSEHEMKPDSIQRTCDGKFCEACPEDAQRRNFGAVQNQSEKEAENRIAERKAREKAACLRRGKKADDIACDTCGHSHDGTAVSGCCSQRQKGKTKLKVLCHFDAEEGKSHIGCDKKSAQAETLGLLHVTKLIAERKSVFGKKLHKKYTS